MSGGRLPNGEYTEDEAEYGATWVAMGRALAEALGLRLHSMNPGFMLTNPEYSYARPVEVTSSMAYKILALKEKADKYDKLMEDMEKGTFP